MDRETRERKTRNYIRKRKEGRLKRSEEELKSLLMNMKEESEKVGLKLNM